MQNFIEIFTLPLEYAFMQNALVMIVLISLLTGIVGCFMLLKNLAFISEALAHGIFPGVVISFMLNINLAIGALAAAFLTILGISITSSERKISETTATGILFSSAFAIGVILISTIENYRSNLANFLVGDILGVNQADIVLATLVTAAIVLVFVVFYKQFVLSAFDPVYARTIGVNVKWIDFLLLATIAATIVVAVQVVGNILVIAMLIIPASAAKLTAKRVPEMLLLASIYALICGVAGLYLSYYLDVATGATIVLVNALLFAIIFPLREHLAD